MKRPPTVAAVVLPVHCGPAKGMDPSEHPPRLWPPRLKPFLRTRRSTQTTLTSPSIPRAGGLEDDGARSRRRSKRAKHPRCN